jgi:hypothetical protein
MRALLRTFAWIAGVVVLLAVTALLWINSMLKDDGGAGRPAYGPYTWRGGKPPRGGPTPRADGSVKVY